LASHGTAFAKLEGAGTENSKRQHTDWRIKCSTDRKI